LKLGGFGKMGKLDGKVAIITGGGSGFGEATALLWAKEGAKVVIADWVAEGGEATVRKIKAAGGEAIFVKVDVSKTEDVKKMVNTAVDTYGKLDILFNNAGIQWGPKGPISYNLADYPEEEADRVIAVNFKGVYLGMKYAIPKMIEAGGGSIISTASTCVFNACQGSAVYSGTKGAVYSLSKTVAMEYVQMGIRCNTIGPGPGRTPLHKDFIKANPEAWKTIESAIPMQRATEPEDVANAALFLASDESKYITGQNIMVDGGWGARGFPT
jgi:NAD(P)-dependent dehydrogenase (short-subunit alcohol dehydrogenase family)